MTGFLDSRFSVRDDGVSSSVVSTDIKYFFTRKDLRNLGDSVVKGCIRDEWVDEWVEAVDVSLLGESSECVETGDDLGDLLVFWELPSDGLVDNSESGPEDLVLIGEDDEGIFTDVEIDDLLSLEVLVDNWSWDDGSLVVLHTDVASDSHSSLVVSSPGVEFSVGEKTHGEVVGGFYSLKGDLIFILEELEVFVHGWVENSDSVSVSKSTIFSVTPMDNLGFFIDYKNEIISRRNLLNCSQFGYSVNVSGGKSVISQASSEGTSSGEEVVKERDIVLSSEPPSPNLVVSSNSYSVILTAGDVSNFQSFLAEKFDFSWSEVRIGGVVNPESTVVSRSESVEISSGSNDSRVEFSEGDPGNISVKVVQLLRSH